MTQIELPNGFTMRAPTPADAEAVTRALAASRRADDDQIPDVDDVVTDWAEVDLASEAVVICDQNGEIVAGADVLNRGYCRVTVYGYVDPSVRGHGIGTALVSWGERWVLDRQVMAPDGARIMADHFILSTNSAARSLLGCMGYVVIRTTFVMRIDMDARPEPDVPQGVRIRTYQPGQDDRALFEAGEAAFRDVWGRVPGTVESWTATTHAPSFDPSFWLLAEDMRTRDVLGLCLGQLAVGEGWIRTLGVVPAARRRGMGRALLHAAFQRLYDRGARSAELSVDAASPTNAPAVYERAGMRVHRVYLLYQKELRPGRDLTSLAD
jgi:mycothiol synthase